MKLIVNTHNQPTSVKFTVKCQSPKRLRIWAIDVDRPLTKYTDRMVNMKAGIERDFEMRFPLTPKQLALMVTPLDGNESGIMVSQAKVGANRTCDGIWIEEHARRFIRFAEEFCEQSSYLPLGMYESATGEFRIRYEKTITDNRTGKQLNTPARIGHTSGIIEVAQDKWLTYSVPMRLVILTHEYSHKYFNFKLGRSIDDEVAADINALYMYLGSGYPAIDARLVFAYVFNGNNSDINEKRMNILDDYITKFQNGEVVQGCS